MAVNTEQCPRAAVHGPHGWIPNMGEGIEPDFAQCLGVRDPRDPEPTPERAGREGDHQPLPVGTDEEDTQSVVMRLIAARRELGIRRYGQALQPSNGRDSLWDAFEEALDLTVYLMNAWRVANPDAPIPGLEN